MIDVDAEIICLVPILFESIRVLVPHIAILNDSSLMMTTIDDGFDLIPLSDYYTYSYLTCILYFRPIAGWRVGLRPVFREDLKDTRLSQSYIH